MAAMTASWSAHGTSSRARPRTRTFACATAWTHRACRSCSAGARRCSISACAARRSSASAMSAGCATSRSRSATRAAPRPRWRRCRRARRTAYRWCASTCGGRSRRIACAPLRRRPRPTLEPGLDRLVPLHGVLRLEHPVILIRKVEELAGDAAALQRREGADALLDWHAEVEPAMNHEHGHRPVRHVIHRIEALVVLRLLERRTLVLPFLEPQLLGAVAHHSAVEHAIVRDQALPWARAPGAPVALDPVDHVAAEAAPERTGARAIQEREGAERVAPSLLQILERPI